MFDMYDEDLLFEEALDAEDDEKETEDDAELEEAVVLIDIQCEAADELDDDIDECGGSCKEGDDDLDDDVDDVEEALDLLESEW